MPRSSRGMTAEERERFPAAITVGITKTAMFKTPYHHIKGVIAAENTGEFRRFGARMHCLSPHLA